MEMITEHAYILWLILFIIFCALELASLGLTSIWFAIGALAACVASLLGGNWVIQVMVFIVMTTVVLLFVRPFAVKYINNKTEKTNVESMIGKTGKVMVEISNEDARGMIAVDGMEWTARSCDNCIISKDSRVVVMAIEGVKAIVRKAE